MDTYGPKLNMLSSAFVSRMYATVPLSTKWHSGVGTSDEQQKCKIAVLLIRFALHVHTLYNKQPNSKKTLVFLVGIKILEEN